MLIERKEIETLRDALDETNTLLIDFLNERLDIASCRYVEHNHPLIDINENEFRRLVSNVKTNVDLLLKLKPVKK